MLASMKHGKHDPPIVQVDDGANAMRKAADFAKRALAVPKNALVKKSGTKKRRAR